MYLFLSFHFDVHVSIEEIFDENKNLSVFDGKPAALLRKLSFETV